MLKGLFENNVNNPDIYLFALRNNRETISIKHPNVFINHSKSKPAFPLFSVLKLIKSRKIEILHCHLPKSQYMGLVVSILMPGIKLVFHEQGDILNPIPLNLPAYFLARNRIRQVIACSNEVRNRIVKRISSLECKVNVVYNYVSFKIPREVKKDEREGLRIGFAGRLTKRKGWKDFLAAMALLKLDGVGFEIRFAGDGPDKQQVFKYIRENGLSDRFLYQGFVKKMEDFYSGIDLLIMPSHWEPLGMVHVEAMAFGVPVIASNVPGLNEVLADNENCLLVKAKDPEAIKEKTLLLSSDQSLRERLASKGKETAKRLDINYFEEKLMQVYKGF